MIRVEIKLPPSGRIGDRVLTVTNDDQSVSLLVDGYNEGASKLFHLIKDALKAIQNDEA